MIEKLETALREPLLGELAAWTIEQAIAIQQVPAPTFAEQRRAELVAQIYRGFNLESVEIDALHNVYGVLPGRNRAAPAVMVAAHTDTVFPEGTDLAVRREGSLIYGPGLGDNSVGVAGMLALVWLLRRTEIVPETDIWVVATTGEEGLGDLRGMRAAFKRLKPKVGSVINVEGLAFGHVYHAGIAVRRVKIDVRTAGGHSWLHYGRPSAIHSLMQLGARIAAKQPPTSPRTTFNIGLIEGGQSINSIATEASMWLDMRSESSATLEAFESDIRSEIEAARSSDVQIQVEVVGDRPSGFIEPSHPLVQRAQNVLAGMGVRATLETGSTDGNVSLAEDCPTVTIGITRGGNAHRLDEYIEVNEVGLGVRQLIQLALATAAANA